MKSAELKQKSKPELQRILDDLRGKSRQLRFDLASGKVKNVREIRSIKKDIARILTILNPNSDPSISSGSPRGRSRGEIQNPK